MNFVIDRPNRIRSLGGRRRSTVLFFAVVGVAIHVALPAISAASRFTFSLLPKSFQSRPSLDFHVITELTDEGRKLSPPTDTAPVYYIAQPGQFTQMGDNAPAGETPPDVQQLARAMEAALSSGHYVRATPSTPLPAVAVVFTYGSFARFSMEAYDQQEEANLAQLGHEMDDANGDGSTVYNGPVLRPEDRTVDVLLPVVLAHPRERDDVLRRAVLVGGEKFSRDLAAALNEEARHRVGRNIGFGLPSFDATGPWQVFLRKNESLMGLVEDSFSGCYFVIASAFDYRAMRQGRRVLLWRTKMTVNSSGISMAESLPALVHTASGYLGIDMAEAVTLSRKINRGGKVDFGETRVVETDVPLAAPQPRAVNSTPVAAPPDVKPGTDDQSRR